MTVTLRTSQPCFDVIMGVYRPDGEVAWISLNSQPLVGEDETTPHAVMVSFEDVTHQKELEAKLARATEELEQHKRRVEPGRTEG